MTPHFKIISDYRRLLYVKLPSFLILILFANLCQVAIINVLLGRLKSNDKFSKLKKLKVILLKAHIFPISIYGFCPTSRQITNAELLGFGVKKILKIPFALVFTRSILKAFAQ